LAAYWAEWTVVQSVVKWVDGKADETVVTWAACSAGSLVEKMVASMVDN